MSGGIASERLRSFIERVERLNEEIKATNADKREIFAEAKANGFDTKVMKRCIQLRAQDPSDREEQEHLVDLYMNVLDNETDTGNARAPAPARDTNQAARTEHQSGYPSRTAGPPESSISPADTEEAVGSSPVTLPAASSSHDDFDPWRDMPAHLRRMQ